MPSWKVWIHGLVAATISGAAGGLGGAVGSLGVGDPFNHVLKIAAVSAGFSAVVGATAYLKQSPVPPGWDGVERRGGQPPPSQPS